MWPNTRALFYPEPALFWPSGHQPGRLAFIVAELRKERFHAVNKLKLACFSVFVAQLKNTEQQSTLTLPYNLVFGHCAGQHLTQSRHSIAIDIEEELRGGFSEFPPPPVYPTGDNATIRSDEGLTLETSTSQIFHGGSSTFINSFVKTKFSYFNYRRSTTVSLETRKFFIQLQ